MRGDVMLSIIYGSATIGVIAGVVALILSQSMVIAVLCALIVGGALGIAAAYARGDDRRG